MSIVKFCRAPRHNQRIADPSTARAHLGREVDGACSVLTHCNRSSGTRGLQHLHVAARVARGRLKEAEHSISA